MERSRARTLHFAFVPINHGKMRQKVAERAEERFPQGRKINVKAPHPPERPQEAAESQQECGVW